MFVAPSGPLVSCSVRFASAAAARQFFPSTCGICSSTIGGSRTPSCSSRNSRRMASAAVAKGAAGRRADAGTAHTLGATGHIGGPFTPTKDAPFIKRRLEVFQRLMAKQQQDIKGKVAAVYLDAVAAADAVGALGYCCRWSRGRCHPLQAASSTAGIIVVRVVQLMANRRFVISW